MTRHLIRDRPTAFEDGKTYCGITIYPSKRTTNKFTDDVGRVSCKRCLTFSGNAKTRAHEPYGTHPEVEKRCEECDRVFITRIPFKVYCTRRCKERYKWARRKARGLTTVPAPTSRPVVTHINTFAREWDYGRNPPPDPEYFKRLGVVD